MQTRRQLLVASAAGLATAGIGLVARARAQAVSKPVRIMVGFPAGGGTDMIARILAERLRGPYASAVLVENKAGASARLAAEYVKNAEPDGSVLLFTPDFTHAADSPTASAARYARSCDLRRSRLPA